MSDAPGSTTTHSSPGHGTAPALRGGTSEDAPSWQTYALVTALLTAFGTALAVVVRHGGAVFAQPQALIPPMLALFALTALVWLGMVLVRNIAVMLGRASVRYYKDYVSHAPREWIERPARTFNNLMQVPTLFYVLGLLVVVTGYVDRAQVLLAWIYVAARAVHAVVYIAWNRVPYRFMCWAASCIVLGVMWARFAAQSAGSW